MDFFPGFTDKGKYLFLKTLSELQNVATSTPLNRRIYDTSGEELEEKDEYRGDKSKHGEVIRKDWFESHISRPVNEPDDSGIPPGDGRGAGGIDSWLFTHLERNWLRKVTKTTEKIRQEIKARDKAGFQIDAR